MTTPLRGEVLGQRHVDLLPAGEVQRGDGQLQVALDVTGVEERELVAGAVAVDPEVQGLCRAFPDWRRSLPWPENSSRCPPGST